MQKYFVLSIIILIISSIYWGCITSKVVENNLITNSFIYVPEEFKTIQEAINSSVDGDTIIVSPGTYYENIDYNGKNIVVASKYILENNTDYILNTIIDGSRPTDPKKASCVMFLSGETSDAVIAGFTIRNGTGWFVVVNGYISLEGGGIMLKGSSATIRNNIIINNSALSGNGIQMGGGGGISALWNGNPTIENNIIMNNTTNYGGGIALSYSTATIRNNIIYNNYCDGGYGGGGIFIHNAPGLTIVENNTIVENQTLDLGGGIIASHSSVPTEIKNNIFYGNTQSSGKQVIEHTRFNPMNLFSNINFNYNCTEENYNGEGNIIADPGFSNSGFLLEVSSPCIDSGDVESNYNDIEDSSNKGYALTPSLGSLRNDIGAYGGPNAKILPNLNYKDYKD